MSLPTNRQDDDVIENEDINAIASEVNRLINGTSGSLTPVSGVVSLPSVPVGTLLGYRVTGSATFTSAGFSTITLGAGAYILEKSPSGWVARQIDEGSAFTPPSSSILLEDDFQTARADLYGTPTPEGGAAWYRGLWTSMGYTSASLQMKAEAGHAIHTTQIGAAAFVSTGWLDMSVEVDYDVSGSTGQSVRVAGRGNWAYTTADRSAMPAQAIIRGDGVVRFEPFWTGSAWSSLELSTGAPTTGTMRLDLLGDEARVFIDDIQVGQPRPLNAPQQVGAHAGFLVWSGGRVGAFSARRLR